MSTPGIIRRICRLIIALGLISFAALPGQKAAGQQASAYHEDFESGQAAGWELDNGWDVLLDGGNHVLSGQGHTWARSNQSFDGDMSLSFRLKLLQGRIHLVVRLSDASRYFIGFEADGSDLNKQYFPDEFHNGLAGAGTPHSLNQWHQVKIVLQGASIRFLVDGYQEWTYTDQQPLSSGSFAFETQKDSQAYIDDILVETAPVAAPANPPPTDTGVPTAPISPASLTWERTGGPLGGLGYDVRMRPDNPESMFVTDAWAGVFISANGGATWSPSNAGITTRVGATGDGIPVFSLTVDPNNPDTVWLGTQFQRGIFKSTDGGHTWKKMDNGIVETGGITFRGFTVQPGDSDVVYAAAEISSWAWTPNHQPRNGVNFDLTRGVIYKTTNGGQSWKAVWRGDNLARYIWINPQNANIIYASTGIFDREAANSDPQKRTPGGEGVLKSTDGGVTWAHANNGLGNLYVGSLFMNPSNPDILLAGTGNNVYSQSAGVYLTTDGGVSWKPTLLTAPFNIEAVEFSLSNPSIAYAGNDLAIYRSGDGGHIWGRVTSRDFWGPPGVCAGFPIDFQVDPRNPDRLFANEYGGGNFLSEDGGKTWVDASRGYTGALVRDLASDPTQAAHILAAGRSGIYTSQDGGSRWEGLSFSPLVANDWTVVAVDPGNPQHILASTNWTGMGASQDGGHSWKVVLEDPSDYSGFRAIAFSPSDPKTVYAGTGGYISAGAFDSTVAAQGVYVSHDGGKTWQPANNGAAQDAHVTSLTVDPSNTHVVYAATTNHGLLKSTDGAGSWAQVNAGLPATKSILSVAISPADPHTLFAGFERGAVFKSTNGGQNWLPASSGLIPEASVSDILFDPLHSENLYLADLFSGVYRSTNGGSTWQVINKGLLSRSVNALALSGDGLHLYAATEGGGVYRLDLNGQPPSAVPTATPTSLPATAAATGTQLQSAETSTPTTALGTTVTTPGTPGTGKPVICGSAALLPLALLGLVWRRVVRMRVGK